MTRPRIEFYDEHGKSWIRSYGSRNRKMIMSELNETARTIDPINKLLPDCNRCEFSNFKFEFYIKKNNNFHIKKFAFLFEFTFDR